MVRINVGGRRTAVRNASGLVDAHAECSSSYKHLSLTIIIVKRTVNFIHGQNGSGKSAVLAAIQICLGAAARRTNRARNLKDLVRRDAASGAVPSCAKIRVTILNKGGDGYKQEVYGDTITVEKTIALNGGWNGYRLLDQAGKKVSDKKSDLYEMLDTL